MVGGVNQSGSLQKVVGVWIMEKVVGSPRVFKNEIFWSPFLAQRTLIIITFYVKNGWCLDQIFFQKILLLYILKMETTLLHGWLVVFGVKLSGCRDWGHPSTLRSSDIVVSMYT